MCAQTNSLLHTQLHVWTKWQFLYIQPIVHLWILHTSHLVKPEERVFRETSSTTKWYHDIITKETGMDQSKYLNKSPL